MLRKMALLIGSLALVFLLGGPAYAQTPGPPEPEHTARQWNVTYWNNTSLSGDPAAAGQDEDTNHDWGTGSPHPDVNADRFSIRWTRYFDWPAGDYRCYVWSDDGVRVYIDDRLLIDEWYDHPVQLYSADVSLTAGHHLVKVEYYENGGLAVLRFSCGHPPAVTDQWQAAYYNNRWLSGSPVLTRQDAVIDFDWGYGSPDSRIPSDNFSVRWNRTVHFEPGQYRFTTATDDGVRLWVNHHLLIDRWRDQALASHSGSLYLEGDVQISMEYYENGGVASAHLTWEEDDGTPPQSSDVILIDDTDPGFVTGGSSYGWRSANEGYNGHLTWTWNNEWRRPNYNWARWYPDLALGRYEVFVYIPERYTTTSNARYWVSHRDGYTLRVVDQSANGDRWVSLGTYWFRGTSDDRVSLADVTYEPYTSRLIGFDAVKWVPR